MVSLARSARHLRQKARTYAQRNLLTDRDSLAFFDALSAATYDPEYFFHVVGKYKIIYIEIPKAASSSIITILSRAITFRKRLSHIHRREVSRVPSPMRYGLSRFRALAEDPQTLIFTVTRNPYDRLASCWRDKFANAGFADPVMLRRHLGDWLPAEEVDAVRPGVPLAFDAFVRLACRTAHARLNGHWSAMTDIVPLDLVNFVGRVDAIDETFERLAAAGVPPAAFHERWVHRSPDAQARDQAFTPELRRLVNEAYAGDFATFGYEPLPA